MSRHRAAALFARMLAGPCLALSCTGCGALGHHGVPEDPLFATRKPIEAHPVSGPPILLARAEPVPPPNPYFADDRPAAYAGNRRAPTAPSTTGRSRTVPGILTGRPAPNDGKRDD